LNQKKDEEFNISNMTSGKKEEIMILNNISNITPIPEEGDKLNNNNDKNSSIESFQKSSLSNY